MAGKSTIRWMSDFSSKFVINANFQRRGWQEVETEAEADIYWASINSVKGLFGAESLAQLRPTQLINHFPNHYELTRKDLLAKNIKRYQRLAVKSGATPPSIIPSTFVLPQEYALFVNRFRKQGDMTYILKPTRYIDDPLLLGGKKFDLRLYVLVVSYQPLIVYMSTLGFARCCSANYSREVAELDNMLVHLTNVAVQKGGDQGAAGTTAHGNKWLLENLRLHLEATHGHAATAQLFTDIQLLVVHTLKAVQQVIIQDRHCFELYGFDVLIDNQLNPWLMEVNASPSLTTTSQTDRLLKFKVINDTVSIVTLPWAGQDASRKCEGNLVSGGPGSDLDVGKATRYPPALGSMQLIYDEESNRSNNSQDNMAAGEAVPPGSGGYGSTLSLQTPDGNTVQHSNYVILHG
eukprot:gene13698-13820_t